MFFNFPLTSQIPALSLSTLRKFSSCFHIKGKTFDNNLPDYSFNQDLFSRLSTPVWPWPPFILSKGLNYRFHAFSSETIDADQLINPITLIKAIISPILFPPESDLEFVISTAANST